MPEVPICPHCKTNDHMIKHPDGAWVCHKTHIIDDLSANKPAPKVTCSCGDLVVMSLVGGQYQYTWKGTCITCNIEWFIDCEKHMEEMEG